MYKLYICINCIYVYGSSIYLYTWVCIYVCSMCMFKYLFICIYVYIYIQYAHVSVYVYVSPPVDVLGGGGCGGGNAPYHTAGTVNATNTRHGIIYIYMYIYIYIFIYL